MLTNDSKKSTLNSATTKKSFFGNTPSSNFFSPPVGTIQRQPVPKLPEFSVGNFVNGNFASFDAQYQVIGPVPETGTLFISHGVHMNYPSAMSKPEQTTFETDFVKSVRDKWSNKHLLTLNEPGFSPYQCNVDVSAHVEDDAKDAHTVIDVVKPAASAKRFRPRVTDTAKKEGSKTRHKAKLDFRDPSIEQEQKLEEADFIQQVGNFDFDSASVNADCQADIKKILDFIDTIPIPDDPEKCTFNLKVVGRASSQGSKEYNRKLSNRRAESVLKALGPPARLCFSTTESAGEEEATEGAEFRRVNVGVFLSNSAKAKKANQNMAAHEFGHMIGLGDEYVETIPEIPNTRKKFFGDNPTHYDAVKGLIDEEAANELLIQDSTNIMSKGNEVKRGHYVMFVAAIDFMTRPEIEKATGKKDAKWKVV
jgi:outer membrane protein OmpA-like peptidoglycan-associated protein